MCEILSEKGHLKMTVMLSSVAAKLNHLNVANGFMDTKDCITHYFIHYIMSFLAEPLVKVITKDTKTFLS